MAIKVLHTADVHLGTAFRGLPVDMARIRREELKGTFLDIIDLANNEDVDLLIISGDLFEKSYCSKNLMDFINNGFLKLKRARVIITPGNHDPKTQDSYYTSYPWDAKVYVAGQAWEKISLDDLKTDIYCYGFESYSVTDNALSKLYVEQDKVNIIVFHGSDSTVAFGKDSEYCPFDVSDLQRLNPNYCGIGHFHRMRELYKNCYYCGCPEPTGFDEEGQKGVIVANIDRDNTIVKFVATSRRQYHNIELDVTGAENIYQIAEKIREKINSKDLYRISLKGAIESSLILCETEILREIPEAFYVEINNDTYPQYDLESLAKGDDSLALFVREMLEIIEQSTGEEKEVNTKALYYGLDGLLRGEVVIR